jgi:hypothetical protein
MRLCENYAGLNKPELDEKQVSLLKAQERIFSPRNVKLLTKSLMKSEKT